MGNIVHLERFSCLCNDGRVVIGVFRKQVFRVQGVAFNQHSGKHSVDGNAIELNVIFLHYFDKLQHPFGVEAVSQHQVVAERADNL